MKCEGTDTERPVLPIAGCHIYIHVFVCVCVCVSMMGGGDGQRVSQRRWHRWLGTDENLATRHSFFAAAVRNSRGAYVSK